MSIDFFAGDPDAIVEPWQPQVGQRVRVTAAIAECPHEGWITKFGTTTRRFKVLGHDMRALGAIGVVGEPQGKASRPGHRFYVEFSLVPKRLRGGSYAAAELEPIE